jgi:hypothetical protein
MGNFIRGRRHLPAAVLATAINGMQRTWTVRTFIKPTHKSVTETIVFLQLMTYLALGNARGTRTIRRPRRARLADPPGWETLAYNNILRAMFRTYYYVQLDLTASLTKISQIRILFPPTKCWICCPLVWNYITQLLKELGRKYAREWTLRTMKCEGSIDTLNLHKNLIPQAVTCMSLYIPWWCPCQCWNTLQARVKLLFITDCAICWIKYGNLLHGIWVSINSTNCYTSQLSYTFEFHPLLTIHLRG